MKRIQGRAQKFEKGGPQFPVHTFPLKISVKTKKKKVFTSSDVEFIPQNQVKTKKRSTRPHMSCFHCSADCRYISAYISAEGGRGGGGATLATPLDTPLKLKKHIILKVSYKNMVIPDL